MNVFGANMVYQPPKVRAQIELRARRASGYLASDSPLLPAKDDDRAILTGTAWHRGTGCRASCWDHGVCAPPLGRCDCAPGWWGADCSYPSEPAFRGRPNDCTHNDSAPLKCERPITNTKRPPPNRTLAPAECPRGCGGRGVCEGGFCHCRAPYWGVDCALGGSDAPRCSARPCVYVYELPARMNVLSFRSNGARWHTHESDEHMPQTLHLALLASPHRTADANEADFFFVPVWDFVGFGWGSPAVYWRAHRYVTTAWPYFNRSGGRDHLWPVARDAGSCATPWGSLLDELRNGIVLSHWGGVTGLDGLPHERCFETGRDVLVPPTLRRAAVARSPFWNDDPAVRTTLMGEGSRPTLLYFSGKLCWPGVKAANASELAALCAASYRGEGTPEVKDGKATYYPWLHLKRYAFGLRYEVWRRHRNAEGFRLLPTDMPSATAATAAGTGGAAAASKADPLGHDTSAEMLRARFCLAPSGTGFGMRAYHALILGCVPVVIQDDGEHPRVLQVLERSRHADPRPRQTHLSTRRARPSPRLPTSHPAPPRARVRRSRSRRSSTGSRSPSS